MYLLKCFSNSILNPRFVLVSKSKNVLRIFALIAFLFLCICKTSSADRYVVLFVHGLASDADTWEGLFEQQFNINNNEFKRYEIKSHLAGNIIELSVSNINKGRYYALTMLETPNGNITESGSINIFGKFDSVSFKDQGRMIDHTLNYIMELNNAEYAILVGHSMGGLAIYSYLKNDNGVSNTIQVFTIGTPYNGSIFSKIARENDKINDLAIDLGYDPNSWGIINLAPNSPEILSLKLDEIIFQDVLTYYSIWNFKDFKSDLLIRIFTEYNINDWKNIFNDVLSDGIVTHRSQINYYNYTDWTNSKLSNYVLHTEQTKDIEFGNSIRKHLNGLFNIGNGAPTDTVRTAFYEGYEYIPFNNESNEYDYANYTRMSKYGLPTNDVHEWNSTTHPNQYWTQDFSGDDDGDGVFIYNDFSNRTFWIGGSIFEEYVAQGGPGVLGLPDSFKGSIERLVGKEGKGKGLLIRKRRV